jgi:dTDP-glucose pyrophosphorylase
MAGLYSRFRKEGYIIPKFLLNIHGESILEAVLKNLIKEYKFENVLLIANRKDLESKSEISNVLKSLHIKSGKVEFISDTVGQAQTAFIGIQILKKINPRSKKVIFHNIDTILKNINFENISSILDLYDGYIDIFKANTKNFSYVESNEQGLVVDIKEKSVISNMATSGLYCFKDYSIYEECYIKCNYEKEYYISSIYKEYLNNNKKIFVDKKLIDSNSIKETIILGTPIEYESYKESVSEDI